MYSKHPVRVFNAWDWTKHHLQGWIKLTIEQQQQQLLCICIHCLHGNTCRQVHTVLVAPVSQRHRRRRLNCHCIRLRVCLTQWWGAAEGLHLRGQNNGAAVQTEQQRAQRADPSAWQSCADPLRAKTLSFCAYNGGLGGQEHTEICGEFPACRNKMEPSILVSVGTGHSPATPRIHHDFQRLQWSHGGRSACSWR